MAKRSAEAWVVVANGATIAISSIMRHCAHVRSDAFMPVLAFFAANDKANPADSYDISWIAGCTLRDRLIIEQSAIGGLKVL